MAFGEFWLLCHVVSFFVVQILIARGDPCSAEMGGGGYLPEHIQGPGESRENTSNHLVHQSLPFQEPLLEFLLNLTLAVNFYLECIVATD